MLIPLSGKRSSKNPSDQYLDLLAYKHADIAKYLSIHTPFITIEHVSVNKLKDHLPHIRTLSYTPAPLVVLDTLLVCPRSQCSNPIIGILAENLSMSTSSLQRSPYYAKYVAPAPAVLDVIRRASLQSLNNTIIPGESFGITPEKRTRVLQLPGRSIDDIPVRIGDTVKLTTRVRATENGNYVVCELSPEAFKLCSSDVPQPLEEICMTRSKRSRRGVDIVNTKDACERDGGVWDRPCVRDDDCPFFEIGRMHVYPRGGCMNSGYCEMPMGVTAISYRVTDGEPMLHDDGS